ncbi:hypothetical protein KY290_001721 [Solanum tuberosum]|uniref:RNase H type-1 domain-containing protein n=1 Tax=Solanum tuberosum TaxID=4113 RepID=A0ABQ7WN03_SOLTU|nr:hypothetical protein KY284_001760 [Solanum tuberosum]KAH0782123.1 hypothetical protein KY290_001721 [Solanum tuberosum]
MPRGMTVAISKKYRKMDSKWGWNDSFIPGQRLAGIGGIVREKNGKMAALHGIEWCHDNSKSHIILELDSQIAVNMIKGLTPTPWTLRKTVRKIQKKIQNMNCKIIHCFREANCVADTCKTCHYEGHGLHLLKGRRHARLHCKTNENGQTQSCFI